MGIRVGQRGGGWGLLFNLKILLAKESSYEFSPFFFPTSLVCHLWPHSAQVHLPWEIAAAAAVLQFSLWGFFLVTRAGFGML